MSDKCNDGFKEAVCIHTNKVYDSCRDKDCVENIRVYLSAKAQEVIDCAINVKCTKVEIIWVFSDIEPGLATFNKKVILFGSEGNAKVFASKYKEDAFDAQLWKKTNMPKAIVEVLDPISLGAKLVDVKENCCGCCDDDIDLASIPESVCRIFDDNLILGGEQKRVFVSIGIFSIIKLERKVQLLIPAYDFCVPQKECVGATDDNPCDLFDRIDFPVDEFFPPERSAFDDDNDCCCK